MNRIFTFLISLFVLGCGTSCANDDVPVPVDESQESAYFGGRKALVAYFSWGGTTQRCKTGMTMMLFSSVVPSGGGQPP